jgi:hypothetical protein
LVLFSAFLISYFFTDAFQEPLPRWASGLNVFATIIYQTVANVNGATALGEFCDLIFDSLSVIFAGMETAATLDLSVTHATVFLVIGLSVTFFMFEYERYVCGCCYRGWINWTNEWMFAIALIHAGVAVKPSLRDCIVSDPACIGYGIVVALTVVGVIVRVLRKAKVDSGVRTRALVGLVPLNVSAAILGSNIVLHWRSSDSEYFAMAAGFLLQYQAQQVITAHVLSRSPGSLIAETTIVGLWAGAALPLFINADDTLFGWWRVYIITVVGCILVFDVRIVWALSRGLGIPVFTTAGVADGVPEVLAQETFPIVEAE